MSLYRQLWLAIILSMLLALMGSLFASLLSARAYLGEQLSMKNADNAAALALSLSQQNPDEVMVELAVSSLFDSGHYESIRVDDPFGKLLVERNTPQGDYGAPGWFAHLLPISAQPGVAQISSGWKQFGTITLVSHSRFAYQALWQSALEMLGALTLAGTIGGLLGSMILQRLRNPLQTVIQQAQAITERRFVTIPEPKVPELRQLALAMNATVDRLKAMFEEEASRLESVRREANFDPLTGLANRDYFMARLRAMTESEEASGGILLLVRIADLANINQRLGRAATDDLLKRIGKAVGAGVERHADGLAARLNGADFALLLNQRRDKTLADNLLSVLIQEASPFVEQGPTAYIGFGNFQPGQEMGGLLSQVDAALAAAQAEGINSCREAVLTNDDDAPRSAEQWSQLIQRALDQRWVRLISFPVAQLSGGLIHRECPLRLMFDPDSEWLPAGRFLPVAERLRLTPKLDLAAIALGLEDLTTNPSLPGLAVNLSASSIHEPGFIQELRALLDQHKQVANRLWLEVAETGAFKHLPDFRTLCKELAGSGAKLGLEHFGRQFSQIGELHDLALDYLKVDASFIRGIDTHSGNQAFLKGLCGIAHGIGLTVIAEGVVSEGELTALHGLGFDGATGPAIKDPA